MSSMSAFDIIALVAPIVFLLSLCVLWFAMQRLETRRKREIEILQREAMERRLQLDELENAELSAANPNGMDEATLQKELMAYKGSLRSSQILEQVCSICLDEFAIDDEESGEREQVFVGQNCRHAFHIYCISKWSLRKGRLSCPYCKQNLIAASPSADCPLFPFYERTEIDIMGRQT